MSDAWLPVLKSSVKLAGKHLWERSFNKYTVYRPGISLKKKFWVCFHANFEKIFWTALTFLNGSHPQITLVLEQKPQGSWKKVLPFLANAPILNPLKTPENQRLFVFFMGYELGILLRNRLMELSEKCPYSELFWSVFSRIRTDTLYLSVFSPNAGKYGPE